VLDHPVDDRPGGGDVGLLYPGQLFVELLADGPMIPLHVGVVRRGVRADQAVARLDLPQRLGELPGDEARTVIVLDRRPRAGL